MQLKCNLTELTTKSVNVLVVSLVFVSACAPGFHVLLDRIAFVSGKSEHWLSIYAHHIRLCLFFLYTSLLFSSLPHSLVVHVDQDPSVLCSSWEM